MKTGLQHTSPPMGSHKCGNRQTYICGLFTAILLFTSVNVFAQESEQVLVTETEYLVPALQVPSNEVPMLRTDLHDFPSVLADDARSLISWRTAGWIAAGGGLAAVSEANWDEDIREDTAAHARRWGGFNNLFDVVGHPATHIGGASLLYGVSLWKDDVETHRFSRSLLHSLILTDVASTSLKYAFDTTRPNGDSYGFPSGHTASSFAVAAVIEEHYGWRAGIGAYTLAGLVGWHRIDNRNHDLSDVVFGAALGIAIGKAVSNRHLQRFEDLQLHPYVDPEQGITGILLEKQF